ncbi:hypothetical protein, partial [Aeromonas molluscorum]
MLTLLMREIAGNNGAPFSAVRYESRPSLAEAEIIPTREGANKRGNSSRLTQSFHFFMFEPIFSPV